QFSDLFNQFFFEIIVASHLYPPDYLTIGYILRIRLPYMKFTKCLALHRALRTYP
ncbi:MAG: hypothetical protein ACI8T6_001307, partial [Candidatus Poseidoniaceae archaeon]